MAIDTSKYRRTSFGFTLKGNRFNFELYTMLPESILMKMVIKFVNERKDYKQRPTVKSLRAFINSYSGNKPVCITVEDFENLIKND